MVRGLLLSTVLLTALAGCDQLQNTQDLTPVAPGNLIQPSDMMGFSQSEVIAALGHPARLVDLSNMKRLMQYEVRRHPADGVVVIGCQAMIWVTMQVGRDSSLFAVDGTQGVLSDNCYVSERTNFYNTRSRS